MRGHPQEQMRLAGLSEDEVEAAIAETRGGTIRVPPLLTATFLLLSRAVLLVALNVVGFVALFLLLTAFVRG